MLSMTAAPSLSTIKTQIALAQTYPSELSYNTKNMTHRSAVEKWQPHARQTNLTQEWWYTTAFFHDTKDQLYSLMFTNFKFDS
jgi:predicted secreted hydrolase